MILEVVQSKWSLTWYDPLGPRMCALELMNLNLLVVTSSLDLYGARNHGKARDVSPENTNLQYRSEPAQPTGRT